MKLVEKLRVMFRRKPLTEEELSARAEAQSVREQGKTDAGEVIMRERQQGWPF